MRSFLFFARAYPLRTTLMLVCQLLAGILGGLSIVTLLPVLGLVIQESGGSAASTGDSPVGRLLVELFQSVGLELGMGALLVAISGAALLAGGLTLIANTMVGYTVAHVAMNLRLRLLRALMRTRWGYFTRQPIGGLAHAFLGEANRSSQAFLFGAEAVAASFETAATLAATLLVSWKMSLGILALGAFSVLSRNGLVRMTRRSSRKLTRLTRALVSRLTDVLQGVKPIKAMAREGSIAALLEHETNRLKRAMQRQVISKEALKSLEQPVTTVLLCTGLWIALGRWQMPLSEVLVLALLFARSLKSVSTLQRKYQQMVAEEPALPSLLQTIGSAEAECERTEGAATPTLEREVALRGVDLAYDGRQVLRGLSAVLPAGELTALIGPSGSGKTSVTDLLIGLVRPDAGGIFIDGAALEDLDLRRWRSLIGYVPQETFLLNDSVAVNVSLGDPALGPEQVEWALRRASAWDFVSKLPGGVAAPVGERGSLLSGGQRQRIAIARALVHRPRLLILDEVTASLDPETEAEVWQAVVKLRGETTLLAISHQPLLASLADRVYRVEDGRAELVKGEAALAATR